VCSEDVRISPRRQRVVPLRPSPTRADRWYVLARFRDDSRLPSARRVAFPVLVFVFFLFFLSPVPRVVGSPRSVLWVQYLPHQRCRGLLSYRSLWPSSAPFSPSIASRPFFRTSPSSNAAQRRAHPLRVACSPPPPGAHSDYPRRRNTNTRLFQARLPVLPITPSHFSTYSLLPYSPQQTPSISPLPAPHPNRLPQHKPPTRPLLLLRSHPSLASDAHDTATQFSTRHTRSLASSRHRCFLLPSPARPTLSTRTPNTSLPVAVAAKRPAPGSSKSPSLNKK